jgi:hypothetical protein
VARDLRAVRTDDGIEGLQALSDHLRADAVSADDGDVKGLGVTLAHAASLRIDTGMRTVVPERGKARDGNGAPADRRVPTDPGTTKAPDRTVGGLGVVSDSVVAVTLVAQVHGLLERLARQRGLVEGAVLVHRCRALSRRGGQVRPFESREMPAGRLRPLTIRTLQRRDPDHTEAQADAFRCPKTCIHVIPKVA